MLRRVLRWSLVAGALLVALYGVAVVALAADGTFERAGVSYIGEGKLAIHRPADWTRPCHRRQRRAFMLACAHVRGRVVAVEPLDVDGDGDRHVVVAADGRVVVVKIPADTHLPVPGMFSRIDAAGLLSRGKGGVPQIRVGALRRVEL